MSENEIVTLPGRVLATSTALMFTNGINYDEWSQVGEKLQAMEGAIQWWIGDWLNYGEQKWGEMYAQAVDEKQYQTWANYKWVSAKYQFSTRVENLSWTHHREIANVDDESDRIKLLELASENDWNTREIKQKIKEYFDGKLITGIDGYQEGEKIQVNPGEWWRLGRHVLFCGDTSSNEFINKLPQAKFSFADPPYGADVADWDSEFYWEHDYLIGKSDIVAVTPGIISIFEFARLTDMPYRWSLSCWIDNGMTRGELGFGNWVYVALFSHGGLYRNAQDFIRVSISNKTNEETKHKGRKPEGLIAYLFNLFTEKDDFVIDPFLGSGTTLFVANELERICIGGEISPEYCAEIISRWQGKTGEQAERL